ncbi:MAG: sel1 repeat family protein [Holosporales bacterium]|jgi:TPR repeat protein|nr:sel1 repeat family protein [Holosporales bacterium]
MYLPGYVVSVIVIFIMNHASANVFIANYVFNWLDTNKDCVKNYLRRAAAGRVPNAYAAYVLGTLYLTGEGLKKDLGKAEYFIRMAANFGSPEAINSLGDGCYSGDICEKNTLKALEYYEKGAKLGYGPAQFNAGIVLLKYMPKTKNNLRKAVFYLDKASKNSNDLGEMTESALQYKKDAQKELAACKKV